MEAIEIPSVPIPFPAYVMGEKGQPAVIVIQEWWGVTEEITKHAAKIADKGYRSAADRLEPRGWHNRRTSGRRYLLVRLA
jgi:dienelactone hydrolase